MIRPLTDHVDDWPMDPEDTVGYGQPPVLPVEEAEEEEKKEPSPDYQ